MFSALWHIPFSKVLNGSWPGLLSFVVGSTPLKLGSRISFDTKSKAYLVNLHGIEIDILLLDETLLFTWKLTNEGI